MKYLIILVLFSFFLISCKATHNVQYFKSGIEIHPELKVAAADSSYAKELRILNKNPYYTMMILFEDYGRWDKELAPKENYKLFFVWQNVKLFENSTELYTVVTDLTDLYSSVWVFDANKKDCLADTSPIKKAIINYFAKGMKRVSINDDFFTAYRFTNQNIVRE
ncbi:hypothetical protein [Bizionia myxarmorum]|uniref:Lipoprotein n=1 Tax=Bizionia myxarmorum TaxID=291186 RepID=A0A5D0R620_9FLAO|nr:hypothetical protein [Bizionia myxarmorum]TYB76336.1 hypothetical protein ES674_12150 [Bizionia myxarmorum]